MYIHIGSNRMIRDRDIVGIFDLDGEMTTRDTKAFLRRVDAAGRAELAGDDLPRSAVVICGERDGGVPEDSVVYSRLTPHSLMKRATP